MTCQVLKMGGKWLLIQAVGIIFTGKKFITTMFLKNYA